SHVLRDESNEKHGDEHDGGYNNLVLHLGSPFLSVAHAEHCHGITRGLRPRQWPPMKDAIGRSKFAPLVGYTHPLVDVEWDRLVFGPAGRVVSMNPCF